MHWYPVSDHPSGISRYPEFVVDDGLVYPTPRTCPPCDPWFSINGGLVYPTCHHPAGEQHRPWFELVGSLVYPAKGHPDGPGRGPWYQTRATDADRVR